MALNTVVREWLKEAQSEGWSPSELFPRMASRVTRFFTLVHLPRTLDGVPDPDWEPELAFVAKNRLDQPMPSVFTDYEASRKITSTRAFCVMETESFWFLQEAIRAGYGGVILNPETESEFWIDREHLAHFMMEYALIQFAQAGVAWVMAREGELIVVRSANGQGMVPIYVTEEDAMTGAKGLNARPKLRRFADIRDHCASFGVEVLLLHWGLPEEISLSLRHLHQLSR